MSLPDHVDVVVVGGGVAGLMAALAARAAGRSVVVVARAGGASPHWSGAVDVADDLIDATPGALLPALDRGGRLHDNLDRLARLKARHPFAHVAPTSSTLAASVDEALALLTASAPVLALTRRDDGHNHVLATSIGTVKRAGLVPASQHLDIADLAGTGAVIGVVEWLDLAHFGAAPVVEMLRFTTTIGASGAPAFVPVLVPRVSDGDVFRDARAMARALDDEATSARFLAALRAVVDGMTPRPTHLLTPAVLGTRPVSRAALGRIDDAVGAPLRELLAGPPAVPGERLIAALRQRALEAGVLLEDGVAAAPVLESGRLRRLEVRRPSGHASLGCGALVLATGRFLGGGIVRDHVAREALFDLPVSTEGRFVDDVAIGELLGERVADAHAIFRAGVLTDEQLRPLTRDRQLLADNVFGAGGVVAGHDPARDGSGLAVAAWTGRLAGLRASEVKV